MSERLPILHWSMPRTSIHDSTRCRSPSGCWDNAGSESLWSTVKHEHYKRHAFTTCANLLQDLIITFATTTHGRRRGSLGMISPIGFAITSRINQQSR